MTCSNYIDIITGQKEAGVKREVVVAILLGILLVVVGWIIGLGE